jgi:hypothetical protein
MKYLDEKVFSALKELAEIIEEQNKFNAERFLRLGALRQSEEMFRWAALGSRLTAFRQMAEAELREIAGEKAANVEEIGRLLKDPSLDTSMRISLEDQLERNTE